MVRKYKVSKRHRGEPILAELISPHMLRLRKGPFFNMNIPLYFAYGSNMLLSRIENRLHSVEKIGTYTLEGYNLVFDTNEAYANIVPGEEGVEGVLYKLSDWQIKELDLYEGCPMVYKKRFFIADGKIAYLYIAFNPYCCALKPTWRYFNFLLEGAKENNLTKTLEKLEKVKKELKIKKPRGSNGFDSQRSKATQGVFRGRT